MTLSLYIYMYIYIYHVRKSHEKISKLLMKTIHLFLLMNIIFFVTVSNSIVNINQVA